MFQSLFWWKYCPGFAGPHRRPAPVQVSIPCSGGSIALGFGDFTHLTLTVPVSILVLVEVLPWGQLERGPSARNRVSILVLVEVLPWEYSGMELNSDSTSFNPCSGGSIALGEDLVFAGAPGDGFQSLFWWKYCPGTDHAP